ncbi:hypothetical protein GCM10010439_18680 [Actinocorallia aurantiaca]|uniref:Uncharacterized protein n=1 Tax=Actinocorallia aurantiaca TaxID=46204 RepID=A0ABN3U2G0_9ACTN
MKEQVQGVAGIQQVHFGGRGYCSKEERGHVESPYHGLPVGKVPAFFGCPECVCERLGAFRPFAGPERRALLGEGPGKELDDAQLVSAGRWFDGRGLREESGHEPPQIE